MKKINKKLAAVITTVALMASITQEGSAESFV